MKRTSLLPPVGMALLLLLAACTQEELAEGTQLADGQYPLTLTASVAVEAQTRATADGTWDGDETIIVEITDDYRGSWPKQSNGTYTIDKSGNLTLKSGTQSYWQRSNEKKYIRAVRYGNDARALRPSWEVKSDQSNAEYYAEGDLLYAWHIVEKMENANLTFYHQTAKVVVNLVGSSFLTANEVSSLTIGDASNQIVALSGKVTTNPSADDVVLTASTTDKSFIKPCKIIPTPTTYAKSYQALVIPQTIEAGQKLFAIKIDGYDTFYYTVPTDGITWKAGNEYTYDITVTPTGLEVTTDVSIGWTENNTQSSGSVITYTDYKAVGSGTADDPYQISNAVQLKSLASAISSGTHNDKYFKLTNDIDFSGQEWTPRAHVQNQFKGTFDGGGHTITGITYNSSNIQYFALFYFNRGTIKNLTIAGANITGSNTDFATIALHNEGTIDNCHIVNSTITGAGNGGVSGIAESNDGIISNCSVKNCTLTGEVCVSGIADSNSGTIVNCHVYGGSISSTKGLEASVGVANFNSGTIVACGNSATLIGDIVGGVVWYVMAYDPDTAQLIACCNTGTTLSDYTSGICGDGDQGDGIKEITACYYSQPDGDDGTTYGTYTATWTDEIISTMNAAITDYNNSAAANKKCNAHWTIIDGTPVTVAGAPQ